MGRDLRKEHMEIKHIFQQRGIGFFEFIVENFVMTILRSQ